MFIEKLFVFFAAAAKFFLNAHISFLQEVLAQRDALRDDPRERFTYQDQIFDNEMNRLIGLADEHYENMMYREAIKACFYDLQSARDRYRDIAGVGDGMNWQLVEKFIKVGFLVYVVCVAM